MKKITIFDYSGTAKPKEYFLTLLFYFIFFVLRIISFYLLDKNLDSSNVFAVLVCATILVDLIFILKLVGIHIRLINAAGKPFWHYLIPLYNFRFLFTKPKTQERITKKRRWFIPFSFIIGIALGIVVFLCSILLTIKAEDAVRNYTTREERQRQEEYRQERLEREQEIERRTSDFVKQDLTDENYSFAFELYDICDRIVYDYEEKESENIYYLNGNVYKEDEISKLTINNNYLLINTDIKIGDPIEKIYSRLGDLDYSFDDYYVYVSYKVYKDFEEDSVRRYYVKFFFKDNYLEKIESEFSFEYR